MTNWQTVVLPESVVRVRMPEQMPPNPAVFVLLHGWTGDEFSMEPFLQALPSNGVAFLFRAPFHAPRERGGYSWVNRRTFGGLPTAEMFTDALEILRRWLKDSLSPRFPFLRDGRYHWMGFSQVAALTLMQGLRFPETVESLAVLSGFVPLGAEQVASANPLLGKRAFVAHGTQDAIVPFEQGERARCILEQAGAQVTFCAAEVGHKVGAPCMRALREFYAPADNSAAK